MLDINFISQNKDFVKRAVREKGYDESLVEKVVQLNEKRKKLIGDVEKLRAERNRITENIKDQVSKIKNTNEKFKLEEAKKKAQEIKKKLAEYEPELAKTEKELQEILFSIPNPAASDVVIGKSEKENEVLRTWGKIRKFDFTPKDHLELGKTLGILDFERGAKVTGAGFYYLKGDGVLLEMALINYGLDFLAKKGFTLVMTPDMARKRYYLGTGFTPKGPEAQTYTISESDLGLVATAEVTMAGYHADEVLEKKKLPLEYGGYSHCFRLEAGAYGKYSKGLYRVHQFGKVEMFIYSRPETSEEMHKRLLMLEEEFWQSLEIPYRVVKMCTADLGAQASKKYDLEAFLPGRGEYGEITSSSNTTDYQARRLNIKFRDEERNVYVHTLNGTLVAIPRAIIAILENFQEKDGSVKIPEVLQKYLGKKKING